MELTGTLIKILPIVEGQTERGAWKRGGFVIEFMDGSYPRKAAFTLFGEDRLAMLNNLPMGGLVNVTFSVESREYQDRFYTDLRCIRVAPGAAAAPVAGAAPAAAAAAPAAAPAAFATAPAAAMPDNNDDLPF